MHTYTHMCVQACLHTVGQEKFMYNQRRLELILSLENQHSFCLVTAELLKSPMVPFCVHAIPKSV